MDWDEEEEEEPEEVEEEISVVEVVDVRDLEVGEAYELRQGDVDAGEAREIALDHLRVDRDYYRSKRAPLSGVNFGLLFGASLLAFGAWAKWRSMNDEESDT